LIGVVTALQERSKTQPDLTNTHLRHKQTSKWYARSYWD
jgi:hypothetical protein